MKVNRNIHTNIPECAFTLLLTNTEQRYATMTPKVSSIMIIYVSPPVMALNNPKTIFNIPSATNAISQLLPDVVLKAKIRNDNISEK